MKRFLSLLLPLFLPFSLFHTRAQGWPSDYGGVMLQGFYWDSFSDTRWAKLEAQADELAASFDLIWVPQSGWCGSTNNMGYTPQYYWNQRSAFGTEAELRSLIEAFRLRGTGLIADVVVNHREPVSGWFGYPAETYQGETYQMLPTDICRNDDGGATLLEANRQGISLSANNDTGEDWNGCRDLDHKSDNVRRIIRAYTHYLIHDLGYAGFRYDMVKGFSAAYVTEYNQYAQPDFSVGEYWDSNANIRRWISDTRDAEGVPASAAFDFQFRYNVRDAINASDWTRLKTDNRLIADNAYKPYAVTFVENHDTEYRSASAPQDPIRQDTLQANAFLLAMPGTPCVFLRHWQDHKQDIKMMIEARRLVGITNTSAYSTVYNLPGYYGVEVTGRNTTLLCIVGRKGSVTATNPAVDESEYQELLSGPGYRYLVPRKAPLNRVWLDKASGTYDDEVAVRALALTATSGATLVYTTDGTEPNPCSAPLESGTTLHLTQSCTLAVGLVVGGRVVDVARRQYDIVEFQPHTATIYCRPFASLVTSWSTMNFYLWTSAGTELNGSWPGRRITETVEVGGQTWYRQTVDISSSRQVVNAVFSTGSGSPQTIDVTGITEDAFFVVKANVDASGKHDVTDVSATYLPYLETGIEDVAPADADRHDAPVYDLMGRRVTKPLPGHVYLRGGHKYIYYRP